MCGIAAIYSENAPVDPEALRRATRTLHHRGPDAERQWLAPHRRVGLGHTRLSIIDLQTGDQPLTNEDESVHAVVNGEFYGYEAIREELKRRGHHLRTRSDSEIALHLYEDSGTQCLQRLRGEFAFILWDEVNQTLIAARDRFGIKPLYYARHEGRLLLASEVKALLAMGLPARWNREAVYHATQFVYPFHHTLFADVHEVPPGHYLVVTPGSVRVLPYWDFNYPVAGQGTGAASPEESVERMRSVLEEAVRLRLRADVPVACYLSGGLDSCAVLGVASRFSPRPLQAFTLSFDDAAYDERAIAEEMAEKAGAQFTPIEIRAEHLAEHIEDALYHTERPIINAHVVAKYLLSRAVRDAGVKVVLTGEGSDEILGGYAHFRRDMLLHNREGQQAEDVPALLEELERTNAVSQGLLLPDSGGELSAPLQTVRAMLGYVPALFEIWSQVGTTFSDLYHPDFAARFGGRDSFRYLLNQIDVAGQMSGREPVHQSLYLWSKTLLNNYILSNLGDRMEMAHSVEGRVPFMDHKLVETVVRMPVSHKIRGLTEKYVLREAARPVLTDTVYRRQKHPFLSPPSTLQKGGALHQKLQDTLRGPRLAQSGFFDRRKVIELLDDLPNRSTGEQIKAEPILMMTLSMCLLQERFHLA